MSDDPTQYARAELLTESSVTLEGKPFCVLRWGNEAGQMTPEEMRQFGLIAIAAAENAERDASVVRWLRSVDYTDESIGAFLSQMREHRED